MAEYTNIKIGCIGCGFMGSAIISSVSKEIGGDKIFLYDKNTKKADELAAKLGANISKSPRDLVNSCTHIFLAVKPAMLHDVAESISLSNSDADKIFLSIAAGIKISTLNEIFNHRCHHFIRLMPNLPASVSEGMIAITSEQSELGEFSNQEQINFVKQILTYSGRVEQVPESLMDAVTAISGSGPAYAFIFIEALADAAVSFGMPRSQAYIYAAQTLKGSAEMFLQTQSHPAQLKDAVCSPAGTTIEAVKILESKGFRSAIIEAATAAFNKSISLGKC